MHLKQLQSSSSRMHIMNRNWSARKQRLHLQSAAGKATIQLCQRTGFDNVGHRLESRRKDTDQCLLVAMSFCRHQCPFHAKTVQ